MVFKNTGLVFQFCSVHKHSRAGSKLSKGFLAPRLARTTVNRKVNHTDAARLDLAKVLLATIVSFPGRLSRAKKAGFLCPGGRKGVLGRAERSTATPRACQARAESAEPRACEAMYMRARHVRTST